MNSQQLKEALYAMSEEERTSLAQQLGTQEDFHTV
jgi:hypothetical protein